MPKKASNTAATRQLLFRLTEDEYAVLAADAYLQGVTPTECAKAVVAKHVESRSGSDRIQRLLQERREYEAEASGKLVSLGHRDEDNKKA
jgi:hypothetical protein